MPWALFCEEHEVMKGLQRQENFMYMYGGVLVTHSQLTSDHVSHTENTHLRMAFPYFLHTVNKFKNSISG